MRIPLGVAALAVALLVLAGGSSAAAQGRSGADKPAKTEAPPPGKAKKVTPAQAVVAARDILVTRGYRVLRVEMIEGAHVIYYRRGNNGRGRGLGPLQTMVVRPAGDIVVFESAPEQVRIDLKIRLGF